MSTEELLNQCHGVDGEKIKRTASQKVHIPEEPKGGIQRCTRCHARIDSNRKWQGTGFTPSFWRVGVPILAQRSGAMIVTEAQAANFRACGKTA